MNGIKANAQMRLQQDVDLILNNMNLKIPDQLYHEVFLTIDRRYKHYEANEDRIIHKDSLMFRNYYGEAGSVNYYQILLPKHLVDEVLRGLHGGCGKQPLFTKTIIAYIENYYYANMGQLIRVWVMWAIHQEIADWQRTHQPSPAKP